MREIGLVSCTKSKLETPARPRDLYAPSTLFTKASQYCEQIHDDWYVLSAKHHLLAPDGSPIEPYEETLTGATASEKREWAAEIFQELESAELLRSDTTLVFHAGKAYYEELVSLLRDTGVAVQLPVEGLLIGERLGWYNERIDSI